MALTETLATVTSVAQAALAVESVIAILAKHLHDAEGFEVKRDVSDDSAATITITIPKFKHGRVPEASKPLP